MSRHRPDKDHVGERPVEPEDSRASIGRPPYISPGRVTNISLPVIGDDEHGHRASGAIPRFFLRGERPSLAYVGFLFAPEALLAMHRICTPDNRVRFLAGAIG